jgi:type IV pilus assembly protein PilW
MNSAMHNTIHRDQQGLTLIEIMIAITISLLLLAGVMQIFISSKSSYNLQNGLGRLQENGRYAMNILARDIGMAGHYITPSDYEDVKYPVIEANTTDNTTVNTDLGFTVENNKASDVIEITYISATDCLGNATGGTAVDRFYLNGTDLMCLGNGSVTSQILAEGVENMQLLYGEDMDNDTIADVYVTPGNVTEWLNIKSVRIALLINSVESVGGEDTNVYALLNAPPIGPIEDNLTRKVFTRTILLRNKT